MNGMHGIIFSYDKENGLRELIENRVHGSIPFGGDYRIIDFILSSMVNAGVTDVGVIMHGKCQSLLDHLGSGKSWDLSRNFGGLTLLPAFAYNEQHRGDGQFRGRVDALGSVMNYLKSIRQDYVVLSDSDTVINAPLEDAHPPPPGRRSPPAISPPARTSPPSAPPSPATGRIPTSGWTPGAASPTRPTACTRRRAIAA